MTDDEIRESQVRVAEYAKKCYLIALQNPTMTENELMISAMIAGTRIGAEIAIAQALEIATAKDLLLIEQIRMAR